MSATTVLFVLSIGKLAVGQQEYYLRSVADGVEEYYLGSGEAPARWLGRGAQRLQLSGDVTAEALGAVLEGKDPATGLSLWATSRARLPGWDLTFSAPKSVSLLYALGPESVRRIAVQAHEHAVAVAIATPCGELASEMLSWALPERSSSRTIRASAETLTHTERLVPTTPSGSLPTVVTDSRSRDLASIRVTVLSRLSATHTSPAVTASPVGPAPTGIGLRRYWSPGRWPKRCHRRGSPPRPRLLPRPDHPDGHRREWFGSYRSPGRSGRPSSR